jgi:hypothetical protein
MGNACQSRVSAGATFRTILANCRNILITLINGNSATQPICCVLAVMRLPTIAAAVFLTLGAILIGGNYAGITHARRKQVGFSCVPILGGLFGCVGFLLLPRAKFLAFIPPLIDPGFVPMMFALLVGLIRLTWQKYSKKGSR